MRQVDSLVTDLSSNIGTTWQQAIAEQAVTAEVAAAVLTGGDL